MWDTEHENVDCVDTLLVKLIFCVEEDFLKLTRVLSDGRAARKEPTIPKATLVNVIIRDSFTKECQR